MSFQSNSGETGEGTSNLPPRSGQLTRKKGDDRRRCSYCEKLFDAASSNCLPFCCKRCQQIDLHKWMTESYGLPMDGQEDVEHEQIDE